MPLFNKNKEFKADAFVETVSASQVKEDVMTTVRISDRKIVLTRHNGKVYAIDSLCPHAAADLSKGSIRSWQVCCHEHDYCFDIRTGRIVWPEDEVYRLKRYEVKEENGVVLIRLTPPN